MHWMVKNIIDELVAFSNLLPLKSNTLVTQESGSGKILGLKPLIKGGGWGGVGKRGGLLFSLCNCGNEPDSVKKKFNVPCYV